MSFKLDPRLQKDTVPVATLALCELRMMNDSRWPWLVLVPRIAGAEEIHHLETDDQIEVFKEIGDVAHGLEAITGCYKINIAALGNQVRQLHIHIIARNEGDPNWPAPVWGFEKALPYAIDQQKKWIEILKKRFDI